MTGTKEDAYKAAVERAFRNDRTQLAKRKSIFYRPKDAAFIACAAEVFAALDNLADAELVNFNTFAFMLGVSPTTLRKDPDVPPAISGEQQKSAAPDGAERVATSKRWTVEQVKKLRAVRESRNEEERQAVSDKAAERREKKEASAKASQAEVKLLLKMLQELDISSHESLEALISKLTRAVVRVLVALDGRVFGFVGLHNLDAHEVARAVSAGARIERMTFREALVEHVWDSPAALTPWISGYKRLLDSAMGSEQILLEKSMSGAASERLSSVLPSADTLPAGPIRRSP